MKNIMTSVMIGLLICGISNAEDFLLNGFDTNADLGQWYVLQSAPPSCMSLNQDAAFITSGTGSAILSTPSSKDGGPGWPGFVLPGQKMKTSDWRAYTELKFEAFNPTDKKLSLYIKIFMNADAESTQAFDLKPGWQTLIWELPDIADNGLIHEFLFFQNVPPEARTIYVDDLRLSVSKDLLTKKITDLTKLIRDPEAVESQKKVGLTAQYAGLVRQLAELDEEQSLIGAAQKLVSIKDAYEDLEKELNVRLDALAVKAFKKAFPDQSWGWAQQHSTSKVFRDELPFTGKIGGTLNVKLARHEYEATQLVLRSEKPIKNVKVEIGSFVNKVNGKVLPATSVTIRPVGYVKRLPAAYEVDEPVTWYPDPLLDGFDTIDLDAGVWQPYWLEVYAGRDTAAGTYTGQLIVRGDDVAELTVPVEITVWNFELPVRTTLRNIFNYRTNLEIYAESNAVEEEYRKYSDNNGETIRYESLSPGARRIADIQTEIENMHLAHRLSPTRLYHISHLNRISDLKRFIDGGANCFSIIYVGSHPSLNENDDYPEWRRQNALALLKKQVPELKEAGLLPYATIYAFDEIGKNQYKAAKGIFSEIKRLYPEIPIITTAFDDTFGQESGLADLVDIWVPLTPKYERHQQRISEVRKAGKKVWYYTCCSPPPPSANLLLEQTASAPRMLLGMLAWQYQTDGFLYYFTTYWSNDGPLISSGPLTEHSGRSAYKSYNGDGMLIYPGKNGPLPSIRLKMTRDGFEDYEYLHLLKQLDDQSAAGTVKLSPSQKETLKQLLDLPSHLPVQFECYDFTGDKLTAYREKIGEFLSAIHP